MDEAARASSADANARRDQLGVGEYTWGAETIQRQYEAGASAARAALPGPAMSP